MGAKEELGREEGKIRGTRKRGRENERDRGTLEEVYYNGLVSFEMILPCFQADHFVRPTIAFNDFYIGLVLHLKKILCIRKKEEKNN